MKHAALLIVISCIGCRPSPVSLAEGPREYVATDYDAVLQRGTREETLILFDELERALTVTATFETWDFRWAYTIRYAQDYRMTIPQRQRLLGKVLAETRTEHEFFVTLYGAQQRFNDLTRENAAWIVRLVDDTGSETAPSQIESVRRPTILERRYYPNVSVWRKVFRIKFPAAGPKGPSIAPEAKWVGLRFAGAWGNVDLVWDLEEAEASARSEASARAQALAVP